MEKYRTPIAFQVFIARKLRVNTSGFAYASPLYVVSAS